MGQLIVFVMILLTISAKDHSDTKIELVMVFSDRTLKEQQESQR